MGWIFAVLWLLPKLAYVFVLRRRDPELLVERATRHRDTMTWDKVIIPIYMVFGLTTLLVASLDGGRFRWSGEMPAAVSLVGVAFYLLGNGLSGWVILTNPFTSSEARIQSERGQQVVADGPYRFVRHPLYLVALILWPTTPLILGSWWAIIPGILAAFMMIVRTALEDRMLHEHLPGYAAYAQQTRYRLIPGVW
jgi:protein-S-isoprenylcysteine O-methyltransferase Ste14